MGFSCDCELEVDGGAEEERRKAAAIVLASDSVDEDSASQRETARMPSGPAGPTRLVMRFRSADGIPEGELAPIAELFPGLSLTLAYFSLDGEFFGYARSGAAGEAAESEDFAEDTRETVGRRHDGDGIAFVRERYALPRAD
jgi:hypothetical protein